MSGSYDLKSYTKGYFDDNVYFNSPVDYLPRWDDNFMFDHMRKGKIIIASGQEIMKIRELQSNYQICLMHVG